MTFLRQALADYLAMAGPWVIASTAPRSSSRYS